MAEQPPKPDSTVVRKLVEKGEMSLSGGLAVLAFGVPYRWDAFMAGQLSQAEIAAALAALTAVFTGVLRGGHWLVQRRIQNKEGS